MYLSIYLGHFEQFVEEASKFLMVTFVVNFDYLPEFKEEIRLEHVEQKKNKASLSLNSFHVEIE